MKAKLPGSIYKRGKQYWIKYYHQGKVYRESAGSTERQAIARLKARWKEVNGDRFLGPDQERLTVNELIDDYLRHLKLKGKKSVVKTERHAKSIRETFGFDRVVRITSESVERFMVERSKLSSPVRPGEKLSAATINRSVAVLRQAMNHAQKRGRLGRVPHFTRLTESLPRQGFLDLAEFEALVANLPEYVQDAARFSYSTGWRRSEVLGLRWDAVLLSEDPPEVRLSTSKNGTPRSVPLIDELLEIIERRKEARTVTTHDGGTMLAAYVFHRDGKPLRDFRTSWNRACQAAGLKGQLWHDMRRSAVRNMVRAGVPESIAMGVSGHKTASIFKRYDIVSHDDKAEALRRTAEHLEKRQARKVVPIRKKGSS